MHKNKSLPSRTQKHTRQIATFIALSGLLIGSLGSTVLPVRAQVDPAGSVTVAKHANKAAEYWDKGDYARAKEEFKAVIGFVPNSVEYYEGLLDCGNKTNDWPSVVFAAEKISTLSPERKKFYDYDYGMALFNMNRYDEAIPHLKAALATADIPVPTYKPIRLNITENTTTIRAPEVMTARPMTIPGMPSSTGQVAPGMGLTAAQIQDKEDAQVITSDSQIDRKAMSDKLLNYNNAIRSESIVIATYEGYDKSSDIRFNSPPLTHWHIEKFLKGPPLNKSLPLRYDFHTPDVKDPPSGWKFDESKLPEKGSKHILFIEFSVPDGQRRWFIPFLGAYGIQAATEENLNTLDRLLEQHNMQIQAL
jgi:tetratricopeptide (TPR) repeat protein